MRLSIEEVISEVRDQWMDIDGVEGIGQGKVEVDDKATSATPENFRERVNRTDSLVEFDSKPHQRELAVQEV